MVNKLANYKQVLAKYDQLPKHIKDFFDPFPALVENYYWDVSVAYLFSRIELAKNRTILAAIVKLHHTDSVLTQQLVNEQHMTRGKFYELYELIVGKAIPPNLQKKLEAAEKIRDKIVHGKGCEPQEIRNKLANALDFIAEFDDCVYSHIGVKPFGSLQGFKGRSVPLGKATTRWVLLGMGIPSAKKKNGT